MAGDAPARVLVKETNWLGDVVMSLPALRAVRQAYPRAHLSVLVRRELASFFDGARWVDEVIPYTLAHGARRLANVARIVRAVRTRRFELAILFPSSFEAALWAFLGGVPRRVGWARDARGALLTARSRPTASVLEAHQVRWYLQMLADTLGIDGAAMPAAPEVHEPSRERMREWLAARRRRSGPLVALAPAAAYGPAKEWPAARWAALVDALAARHDAECVLVGAPGERARCEEVAAASRAGALVAAGETSVGELVALLSLAQGFAGNDSGAMHVAGALGIPTVGVYGSTSAARTGPLGPRAEVVARPVACSPCFERTCRFGHYECLTGIGVEDVLGALERVGLA